METLSLASVFYQLLRGPRTSPKGTSSLRPLDRTYKLPSIISAVALDSFARRDVEARGASPRVSSDTSLARGEVEVTQVARSTETNSH